MTSGYGPDKLNNRHFVVALMYAAGFRQVDIARATGYGQNRISIICGSPLFQAQVRDLQAELREATLGDAMQLIEREAGNSVRTLITIRDAPEAGANTQRLAANDLLDRHPDFARRTKHDEERTLRLTLSSSDVQQMLGAMRPVEAPIDAEFTAANASDEEGEAPVLRTIEDAIAVAEAQR